jgi:hypothetical protein
VLSSSLRRPRPRFSWWALIALFAIAAASYQVEARSDSAPRSACSASCDHHASDCIDSCEDRFKDDKPRVQCKLACIGEREKCSTACH